MNIWIIQHYATPPDTVSGTRHFNFAKYLKSKGHNVTIFASSFNHSTFNEERLNPGEMHKLQSYDGVNFCWIKTPHYISNGIRRMANMIYFMLSAVGRNGESRYVSIVL